MRSIRLSLTVYFLALAAIVLGAVSLVVYGGTTRTLQEKQRAAEQLLKTRFDEDCLQEKNQLDAQLFDQAKALAREVQFRSGRDFLRYWPMNSLGSVAALPLPMGPISAASWAAQCNWFGDFNQYLTRRFNFNPATKIALNHADLPAPLDPNVPEYFQIDSVWRARYTSPNMMDRTFSFDPSVFSPRNPVIDLSSYDDYLGDVKVRRVRLLAPAARYLPFGSFTPPRGRGGRGGLKNEESASRGGPRSDDSPATPRPDFWTRPALCIQYASEVTKLDANLTVLQKKLETDLTKVEQQTLESQASLRRQLLLINGLAFTALLFGAFWLVRLGLAPLSRVSNAVSQVSEVDFQLHLDSRKLPRELTPIVEGLTQTLDQLQCAFAREKQATADISHELRTPLSALLTTIDVTLRKPRSAEEYRDALGDCRTSATQINQAVERLLALARLDAGVDRLRTRTVDAADVAKQCVAVVRPLAEARGLHLSLQAQGETVLDTDPDKLREVLNNLLHNAIEYNRPDGSIAVALERENGHVRVQVRDTGIGIAPAARPHLFERFYRADPSRQADGMHAGLGLAIVKGYLDLMGGTIEVDSTEGQGTTFCVSLPA